MRTALPDAPAGAKTPVSSSTAQASPGTFNDVLARLKHGADEKPAVLGELAEGDAALVEAELAASGLVATGAAGSGASLLPAAVAAMVLASRRNAPDAGCPPRAPRADPLDPAARHAAQIGPPPGPFAPPPPLSPPSIVAPVQVRAAASLEDLLPALVRRIAWSGDGRKASLRLEFGSGDLQGGVLVVHADEGRVAVEISAPAGVDVAAWRTRIEERLRAKDVSVASLVVE